MNSSKIICKSNFSLHKLHDGVFFVEEEHPAQDKYLTKTAK